MKRLEVMVRSFGSLFCFTLDLIWKYRDRELLALPSVLFLIALSKMFAQVWCSNCYFICYHFTHSHISARSNHLLTCGDQSRQVTTRCFDHRSSYNCRLKERFNPACVSLMNKYINFVNVY